MAVLSAATFADFFSFGLVGGSLALRLSAAALSAGCLRRVFFKCGRKSGSLGGSWQRPPSPRFCQLRPCQRQPRRRLCQRLLAASRSAPALSVAAWLAASLSAAALSTCALKSVNLGTLCIGSCCIPGVALSAAALSSPHCHCRQPPPTPVIHYDQSHDNLALSRAFGTPHGWSLPWRQTD